MEDNKLKGIMLGGSDLPPNCRDDQYHVVDSFVPMISDEEYLDSLPVGYRFAPTDEELIVDYLSEKIKGMPLPPNRIMDIKVYDFLPCYLFETYKPKMANEVYFFTVREKKNDNGHRPKRVAGDGHGYWRASQKEQPIFSRATGRRVGYKRSLAYHEFEESRESKRGVKTPWLMHEYRIGDNVDEWVICKIYERPHKEVRVPQPTDNVPNDTDTGAIPSPVPNETDTGAIPSPLPSSEMTLAPLPDSLSVQSYERVPLDDDTTQNSLDWYHAYGAAGLATYDQLLYDATNFDRLFSSGGTP